MSDYNPAPWARTPPAHRTNAAREEAAKSVSKPAKADLQALEDSIAKIGTEWSRLTDPAKLDAEEIRVRTIPGLRSDQVAEELAKIKKQRQMKEHYDNCFSADISKVVRQMLPAAKSVLECTLKRVRRAIEEFARDERGDYWGIEPTTFDNTWFLYPMQRLESILLSDIEQLTKYPQHNEGMIRSILIDSGVIEPKWTR